MVCLANPLIGDIAHVTERGTAQLFPDIEPPPVPLGEGGVPWAAEVASLHSVVKIQVYSTCNLRASNCSLLP